MQKLLVIAGSGSYPEYLIKGARKAGVEHISLLAIRGMTSRRIQTLADETFRAGIGEGARYYRWIQESGFTHGIMVGQIRPLALFRTRFDTVSRGWLKELPRKNAHTIFGKVASLLEENGIKVLPASSYMDDCLPGTGLLTNRKLDEREQADIDFGHKIASEICGLDIGQTLVVKDGAILAVEALEGTNKTILRGGRLGGKGAVVVKVAVDNHDMRFDIPVAGIKTISKLKRAGISALAFQAGRLIMLDREKVIRKANRMGIAIIGIDSGLPQAPTRPGKSDE
ncbi:MAG: UDP-2,3-diacylglucosamine diphosphatase LpxI [Kiritimatiellia bacterium]